MAPESQLQVDQRPPNVNLFALAGRSAPRLKELQTLPAGMCLIGIGRPSDEVAGKHDLTLWTHVLLVQSGTASKVYASFCRLDKARLGKG